MPSPLCEVKDGAGSYTATANGVDVTPTNTITIRLIDTSADVWSIACVYTDDTSNAATVTASLVIDTVLRTATFTAPVAGKAYIFRSVVNNGIANGRTVSSYTTTFGIYTLTGGGDRVLAANETTEGDATFGWIKPVNELIRGGGGGGATPGGSSGDLQVNNSGALSGLGGAAGRIVRRNNAGTAWEASADFVEFPEGLAAGDLLYYDGTELQRIPIGTEGQVLKIVSGVPAWADDTGGGGGGYLATLNWEGLWLAPYSGSPWVGTASAGSSGSRNLTESTDPPAVGSSLNGKAGALFQTGDVISTGLSLGTFVNAGAYSFAFVAQADSVAADPGAGNRNTAAGLFGDSGATYLCCAVHAGGITLSHFDGAYKEVTVAFSTGVPHRVQGYYDGTNINIAVDGVWGTPVAAGSLGGLTGNVRIGAGATNVRFPGTIWAAAFSKTAFDISAQGAIDDDLVAEFAL